MSQTLRRRRASELVNQEDVLLLILTRCDAVTVSRCRNVCRRWRKTIDHNIADTEEKATKLPRPLKSLLGHGRIVVCDRRRAALHRIEEDQDPICLGRVQSSPELYMQQQPLDTTLACVKMNAMRKAEEQKARRGWNPKRTTHYKDQYAHQGLPGWSYKFDFGLWTSRFDIDEVWLENFGSFLERSTACQSDQGPMYQTYDSDSGSARNPFPTPPHSQEALKVSPRANAVAAAVAGANRPVSPPTPIVQNPQQHQGPFAVTSSQSVPYNMLPSTQVAQVSDANEIQKLFLDDQICAEMARISGGRFERLIQQLKDISPLHLTFQDHSLYPRRPTMLLFWFLKQLKANLRKVTFDNVQGEQRVKLENVLDVSNIDELNIVQPPKKVAIEVDAETLNAFVESRQHSDNQRPIRLRICGKTGLTAAGLLNFIKKWQSQSKLVKLELIQIDTASISLNDWLEEVQKESAKNSKLSKCTTDMDRVNKVLCFRHIKTMTRLRYTYEDGYLKFSFVDPQTEVRNRTTSSSSSSSATNDLTSVFSGSFQSQAAYRQNSSSSSFYSSSSSRKNSQDRRFPPTPQNEYEIPDADELAAKEQSMFTRIFSFMNILRSNA
ncbi:hypothetical protein L596_011975 [Steinernema carpocapsae]|uniref:F-box domain-containing protein n=1 Tax=Steinernema carpocapsae TaxID=34508 RepID=A0A4U5NW10_STECR|nr:hypothetical protein L596_011975 [Steinernema carpocapsae]